MLGVLLRAFITLQYVDVRFLRPTRAQYAQLQFSRQAAFLLPVLLVQFSTTPQLSEFRLRCAILLVLQSQPIDSSHSLSRHDFLLIELALVGAPLLFTTPLLLVVPFLSAGTHDLLGLFSQLQGSQPKSFALRVCDGRFVRLRYVQRATCVLHVCDAPQLAGSTPTHRRVFSVQPRTVTIARFVALVVFLARQSSLHAHPIQLGAYCSLRPTFVNASPRPSNWLQLQLARQRQ